MIILLGIIGLVLSFFGIVSMMTIAAPMNSTENALRGFSIGLILLVLGMGVTYSSYALNGSHYIFGG